MRAAVHRVIQRAHFSHGQLYDRHAATLLGNLYRRAAHDVSAAAPRGGTVLDAGCGSGHLAVEIARRRPDLHVHGVDLEPGMIATARRRAERDSVAGRVRFTAADLADLPLPDGSADLIVSTVSLHHWTDPGAVLASLGRVLRPDGRIWIYDFRFVASAATTMRAAASSQGLPADRTVVRTGWFPAALFQCLAIEPAQPPAATGN